MSRPAVWTRPRATQTMFGLSLITGCWRSGQAFHSAIWHDAANRPRDLPNRRRGPDRTSSSTPTHRPCAQAVCLQRTRPGCTTAAPAVTRARDNAPARRRAQASFAPSCPGRRRHCSQGVGPGSRHIGVTRRAPGRPWRRLARACATPFNRMTHTVESRTTVRRIEAESTFRQATGELSIIHLPVVGTHDVPRHIACLDLGTRGHIGAPPPESDAGKESGLGAAGLPFPLTRNDARVATVPRNRRRVARCEKWIAN